MNQLMNEWTIYYVLIGHVQPLVWLVLRAKKKLRKYGTKWGSSVARLRRIYRGSAYWRCKKDGQAKIPRSTSRGEDTNWKNSEKGGQRHGQWPVISTEAFKEYPEPGIVKATSCQTWASCDCCESEGCPKGWDACEPDEPTNQPSCSGVLAEGDHRRLAVSSYSNTSTYSGASQWRSKQRK